MADEPVLALERELVRAAERQALRAAPATADPRGGTSTGWRWRPRLGVLAATSFALIPVLVVIGVVIAIRGNQRGAPALVLQKPVPSLVGELGVLRRPQTHGVCGAGTARACPETGGPVTAISPPLKSLFGVLRRPAASSETPSRTALSALQASAALHGATLDRAQLRSVRVRLWPTARRTTIDLVTVRSPAAGHPQELAVSNYPLRGFAAGRIPPPTYFGMPVPLETLASRGLTAPLQTDTKTGSDVVVVVPEGIARVVFTAPGQRPISAPVSDNVAGFHVPGRRFALMPIGAQMTWYTADGQVLRQISGA
jgi:hypothetical protein